MVREMLQSEAVKAALETMCESIHNDLGQGFVLIGIMTGGKYVAEYLHQLFQSRYGFSPSIGHIDITLYRDDLYTGLERPALGASHVDFAIEGKQVLLVDDVLFTGRTVVAAFQQLADLGRPKVLRLAVLIDRGHREFPITADYIGFHMKTSKKDKIELVVHDHCPDHIIHHIEAE